MAFQKVPETADVSVIHTCNGVTVQNSVAARKVGGYNTADLSSLANIVDQYYAANVLPYLSAALIYVKTEVRGLDDINDQVVENVDGSGFGGIASNPLPNNVSYVIKRLSGLTGRSARGRLYIPGIPENARQTDENYITSAFNISMVGGWDSIRSAIGAVGWVPVIVSRYSEGVKRAEGVTFVWNATSNTDLRLDTRRGRLPPG